MPDLRIYPDRELLVKPRVCQGAITIGALIDHCIELLPNHYDYEFSIKMNPIIPHRVIIYHFPTSRYESIDIMPPIRLNDADYIVAHMNRALSDLSEGTIDDVF